jgi:hypothetical protein
MNEEFKPEKFFTKDGKNLEMLKQALGSEEIDKDIIPILEKFFSLPITPTNSCYGHWDGGIPYLSYVDDETQNEQELGIQKLFREKITELANKINQRIGSEAVSIRLEGERLRPKEHTLRFDFIDKKIECEMGVHLLDIIWEEFSKYLDELK